MTSYAYTGGDQELIRKTYIMKLYTRNMEPLFTERFLLLVEEILMEDIIMLYTWNIEVLFKNRRPENINV